MNNPYKILGVSEKATDEEIKRAYHALARRYHPDRFAGDEARTEMAGRKMRDINEAYDTIVRERENTPPPFTAPREEPPADPPRGRGTRGSRFSAGEPRFTNADYVRTLLEGDNYAAALGELYRTAEDGRTAEWYYLASQAHLALRHLHEALEAAGRAVRKEPKNAEYRRWRDDIRKGGAGFAATQGEPKEKKRLLPRWLRYFLGLD